MALLNKAQTLPLLSQRSSAALPVSRPVALGRRATIVRAETPKPEAPPAAPKQQAAPTSSPPPVGSPTNQADALEGVTKKFEELLAQAQKKWESTSDNEKPAAIAIVIASVIAQVAIGATVDAVERIPFISPFLEFVGLAVTGVYAYRYATDPAEREGVQASLDSFTQAVTGKKN